MFDDYDKDKEWTAPSKVAKEHLPEKLQIELSPEAVAIMVSSRIDEFMTAERLHKYLQASIHGRMGAVIDAYLETLSEQAITSAVESYFTGERWLTDKWGDPKPDGAKETLREAILKKVEAELAASTSQYGERKNAIHAIVQKQLFEPLKKDLEGILSRVKKEQKEQAESFVAKMLAASMKSLSE